MKKTIIESTTFDNIMGFVWALSVLSGTSYLVFWKGISGWWFILGAALLSTTIYHKKTTTED